MKEVTWYDLVLSCEIYWNYSKNSFSEWSAHIIRSVIHVMALYICSWQIASVVSKWLHSYQMLAEGSLYTVSVAVLMQYAWMLLNVQPYEDGWRLRNLSWLTVNDFPFVVMGLGTHMSFVKLTIQTFISCTLLTPAPPSLIPENKLCASFTPSIFSVIIVVFKCVCTFSSRYSVGLSVYCIYHTVLLH